jgi:hypothetical protein
MGSAELVSVKEQSSEKDNWIKEERSDKGQEKAT